MFDLEAFDVLAIDKAFRACTLGRKLNWHESLDFGKWESLE